MENEKTVPVCFCGIDDVVCAAIIGVGGGNAERREALFN